MTEPEQIGHYRLISPIAEGAMGKVYLAEHDVTKRKVALKLLRPEMFGGERARQRFLREAQAASIEHPNLIQVTDAGEEDGHLYIAMRYVRGRDLGRALVKGPLPPEQAVSILAQIASALDASHRAGLIHRDVKPSNILLTNEDDPEGPGVAFLCDFGITRDENAPALTQTGFAPGTRSYMAPEQFKGSGIQGASDQYSLACVAYELLAGRRPFEAPTEEALMYQHLSEQPAPASSVQPQLGSHVDEVLARALSKDPVSRFPTCVDFTDALRLAIEPAAADSVVHAESAAPAAATDRTEAPTLIAPPPDSGSASPKSGSRNPRKGLLIAAAIFVVAVLVAGGLLAYFRSPTTAGNAPAVAPSRSAVGPVSSPSPPAGSPSPSVVIAVQPVSQASLEGPYRLDLRYVSSNGFSHHGSDPFWHNWPIRFEPVCVQGPCNVQISFDRFGVSASGTLQRQGEKYFGTLSTKGISTCAGHNTTGGLQMFLRVDRGRMEDTTWRADQLSGWMKYKSTGGGCTPVSWTADTGGTALP